MVLPVSALYSAQAVCTALHCTVRAALGSMRCAHCWRVCVPLGVCSNPLRVPWCVRRVHIPRTVRFEIASLGRFVGLTLSALLLGPRGEGAAMGGGGADVESFFRAEEGGPAHRHTPLLSCTPHACTGAFGENPQSTTRAIQCGPSYTLCEGSQWIFHVVQVPAHFGLERRAPEW